MNKKLYMGVFDSMLVKYGAFLVGYGVLGIPVFGANSAQYMEKVGADASVMTQDYIRNSSLLINLAKAIGKLVISYKEIQHLAGYTTLIYEMKQVLGDLEQGRFVRTQVVDKHVVQREDNINEINRGLTEFTEDYINFDRVPIISPNGDVLVKEISFEIHRGMNTVISGPNGCGKSSLFRILSGLWPLAGGVLRRPHMDKLFYIPQRPYLPPGTLRDQIIYPHSKERITRSDEEIRQLLNWVKLDYVEEREKGFDSVNDWNDVLSGGEKQRIAMARLFYHRPLFAILDECTSAMSMDVEAELYLKAKELGITLFTVSHRVSLFKYHEYMISFDGNGNYELKNLKHD